MPEINKTPTYREPYTPSLTPSSQLDRIVSTSEKAVTTVSFSPSEANYLIIPVYMDKDGKYKVAKDVGKAGAESEEDIATDILIYDLKTKGNPSILDLKSIGVTDSTQPGIDLCKYIGRHYPRALLAMEKVLKYLESPEGKKLEDIILTYIVKTGENAEEVAERVDRETGGEKEYKGKEEKYEGKKGELEETEVKKELKGEEGELTEGKESVEKGEEAPEEGRDVETSE